MVKFESGVVVREAIITVDEDARRLVWSAESERLTHHNASLQVLPAGNGTRIDWVADLLPDAAAPVIASLIEQALRP